MHTLYYVLTFCFLIKPTNAAEKADYYKLYAALFDEYVSDIRPVNDDDEVMSVGIDFRLTSIDELREKDQTLVSFGYIRMIWDDDFLSWNKAEHNDISNIVVPQNKVWRPDVVIGNSVEQRTMMGFDEMPIRLNYDGFIDWEPSNVFQTACDIDIQYYPFDTQICSIVLEPMVSRREEIELTINTEKVLLDEYNPNGQWELVSTSLEKKFENDKSSIHIKLTLKRLRNFYIMYIILPILLLSFMGSLTFALPADAGEKMSLSITVLLAYIVFLTIISDSMPQTSLQISILGLYLAMLVALSALSVLISIPVLRLHHKASSIPVPPLGVWFVRRIGQCSRKNTTASSHRSINAIDVEKTKPPFNQNHVDEIDHDDDEKIVTWKHVSETLDCLFCWIFIIITVVSTVVFIVLLLI